MSEQKPKPEDESGIKRYNLAMPTEMFNAINEIAQAEQTSMLEILRRMIKLGLIVHEAQLSDAKLILRDASGEKEIWIVF